MGDKGECELTERQPVPADTTPVLMTPEPVAEQDAIMTVSEPAVSPSDSCAPEDDSDTQEPAVCGVFAGKKAARAELLTSLKLVAPVMVSNIISLGNNLINAVSPAVKTHINKTRQSTNANRRSLGVWGRTS